MGKEKKKNNKTLEAEKKNSSNKEEQNQIEIESEDETAADKTEQRETPDEIIARLEKEIKKLKDRNLRTMAEFENFRRRSSSEKSSWIKNATQRLVLEVCDVLDNFERAIQSGVEEHNFKSFFDGVQMIYNQLENVLKKEGVEKIEAEKKNFDPNYHEALAHVPSKLKEGKITAIIQNGYKMNNKIIRPAKVAVSNGQKPEKKDKKKKKNK